MPLISRRQGAWIFAACLFFAARGVFAEPTQEADVRSWAYSGSILGYLVPHDGDYAQPTLTADRKALHLEARYNYEELDSGSVWAGYNVETGRQVSVDFTAMAGGVFGALNAFAPGYRTTVGWKQLELFSEGEYVFDVEGHAKDFFYTWSELNVYLTKAFRVGGVIQRTRAYETNFDIQRGFLLGISNRRIACAVYVFNPQDEPLVVLGLNANF